LTKFLDLITSINAKKVEHKVYLQVIDSRDNIEMLVTKWKHISKAKWPMFIMTMTMTIRYARINGGPFYEYHVKIQNCTNGIGHNEKYWDIFAKKR
jgi:hypothetical protein